MGLTTNRQGRREALLLVFWPAPGLAGMGHGGGLTISYFYSAKGFLQHLQMSTPLGE